MQNDNDIYLVCPRCGSDDEIDISAHVWVRFVPESGETDADDTFDHSHEWASEDAAICRRCDYRGTVNDFSPGFNADGDEMSESERAAYVRGLRTARMRNTGEKCGA